MVSSFVIEPTDHFRHTSIGWLVSGYVGFARGVATERGFGGSRWAKPQLDEEHGDSRWCVVPPSQAASMRVMAQSSGFQHRVTILEASLIGSKRIDVRLRSSRKSEYRKRECQETATCFRAEREYALLGMDTTVQGEPGLRALQDAVLEWYRESRRLLPWRQTRDPYRILVSEVMLQQTQVERVLPYYERFLAEFPDVETLARAPLAKVIEVWGGLGYNRRAVYLWRAAHQVVQEFNGIFPQDWHLLERLPGVGRYTARAVVCFAYGVPLAFWDTNIARALTRLFAGPTARLTRRELDSLAEEVLSREAADEWNQALIELGARICMARRPSCPQCPVRHWCRSVGTAGGVQRRRAERFEGSRRYFRGRIVALLRGRDGSGIAIGELMRWFGQHGLPVEPEQLEEVVQQLARDGLVEIAEERGDYVVRLPRAGGEGAILPRS